MCFGAPIALAIQPGAAAARRVGLDGAHDRRGWPAVARRRLRAGGDVLEIPLSRAPQRLAEALGIGGRSMRKPWPQCVSMRTSSAASRLRALQIITSTIFSSGTSLRRP